MSKDFEDLEETYIIYLHARKGLEKNKGEDSV